MRYSSIFLVLALAVLSGCSPTRPSVPAIARSATDAGTSAVGMDSRRDIVLAVINPLDPPATHAGSSMLGYAAPKYYGAGERAASELTALKQSYRLREVAGWPIKALGLYCVVLEIPPDVSRDAVLKALAKDRRVQLVQPLQDFAVYSDTSTQANKYNDPYVNLQRGFVDTDAAAAQVVTQGAGVNIAIVDTGVDTKHPELRGRIRDVHDAVDDNAVAFDHDYHGTEVAGIIAADGNNHQGIVGIAPKATLSVYKACWYPPSERRARCNSFTLAKALAAVLDTDARIVNLSLGGPADPLLNKLLAQLLEQGRIVIAAMPPSGALNGFPDDEPGVIVVRSSSPSPAPPGVLSAPGDDILTTQPDGGYDFTSGSSMATAHVSGIAALLLSLAPRLNAPMLHDLLLHSSKVSDGVLQVNAAQAVAALHSASKAP